MIELIFSEMGRKIALVGTLVLLVIVFLLKVFNAGKTAARVDGMREQLQNAATRAKVDDTVNGADDTQRSKLRAKWQRD